MEVKNFNSEVEANVACVQTSPEDNEAAKSGSTLLNETRRAQDESGVELPPVIHNPTAQQHDNAFGDHPPAEQPGYPNPAAAPSEAGVLSREEILLRRFLIKTAIRQEIANEVIRWPIQGRRRCSYTLPYILPIFGVWLGSISLICLGTLIVQPTLKRMVIDSQLRSARCGVISSEVTDDQYLCSYQCKNEICTSSYPCLQIQVAFYANGKNRLETAYLYDDVLETNKDKVRENSVFHIS